MDKIKLWTSRTGSLHGVKSIEKHGELARLTTHCGKTFTARNSRNSRGARNLRNKWFLRVCPKCGIPEWKLAKFSATRFSRHIGSTLQGGGDNPPT